MWNRIREIDKRLKNAADSFTRQAQEIAKETLKAFETQLLETQQQALLSTGQVLYLSGKYGEAIEALSKALEIHPDHADALYFRGCSYAAKRPYAAQDAVQDLRKALQSSKWSADHNAQITFSEALLEVDDWDGASRAVDEALRLGCPDRARAYCIKAEAQKGGDDFAGARRAYEKCLDEVGFYARALNGLLQMLLKQHELDEVVELASKWLESGAFSSLYTYRARARWERNEGTDRDLAYEDLNRAEKVRSQDMYVYLTRGTFRLQEGKLAEALAELQRGLNLCGGERKSRRPTFRNQICRVLVRMGKEAEAVAEALKSVEQDAGEIKNHMTIGSVYLACGCWAETVDAMERALKTEWPGIGKILLLFFRALGAILAGINPEKVRTYVLAFAGERQKVKFDAEEWDWSAGEERVRQSVVPGSPQGVQINECLEAIYDRYAAQRLFARLS